MNRKASLVMIACVVGAGIGGESAKARSQSADESGQDLAYVNRVVREYVRQKYRQMDTAASNEGFRVHEYYHRLFLGMTMGNAGAVSNAYAWIEPRIKQYKRHPGGPDPNADLNNPAWQYVLEAHGAWDEVSHWTPQLLRIYANDILSSIPNNAVLFAGTDPGRFVLSAFNDILVTNGLVIVTQNALSDNQYMAYARRLYGDRMSLPDDAHSARAFEIYVKEVQSGKRPANAQLDIKDGRVTVSGAVGIMEINGILAQMIFEQNKHDRPFFVEESYVIPWMYPFLTPHGLILRLNSEPTPLTDAMVEADHEFWSNYERMLRGQKAFSADTSAQKMYSKLRSSIGGVYAFRGRLEDAQKAFRQALSLYPLSPDAHFGLAQAYLRFGQFDKARALMQELVKKEPANDAAGNFIRQIDGIQALRLQIQQTEAELQQQQPADAQKVLRLAGLYLQAGRQDGFLQVAGSLLESQQMPSFMLMDLARLYDQAKRPQEMGRALTLCLQRLPPDAPAHVLLNIAQLFGKINNRVGMRKAFDTYLERNPTDWRAWLDLATLDITSGDQDQANASLDMAVRYGGADAQQAILQNQILEPVWQGTGGR